MKPLSKILTCTLILAMIASTLTLAESAYAQTLSLPEFTLKYDAANKALTISIHNQPFTPYVDEEGNLTQLFYSIGFFNIEYAQTLIFAQNTSVGDYTNIRINYPHLLINANLQVSVQPCIGVEYNRTTRYSDHLLDKYIPNLYPEYNETVQEFSERGSCVTKVINIPNGDVSDYTEPTHTATPTSTPTPISTPYVYSSKGNPQDSSITANGASDSSLGWLKISVYELVLLVVVSVILSSLLTLGLTRRNRKRIDSLEAP